MDLILITAAVVAVLGAGGTGYLVGRDAAERKASDTIASLRAKQRRLERDLFLAYEETRMVRRHKGGGAA